MLEDLTQKLTADYSSDGTQSGSSRNTKEELSCKLADISAEIDKQGAKVADHIARIKAVISAVEEPDLYAVLSRRYISYQSMGDIAEAMHYDRKTIQRKHKAALDEIMSLNVAP